MVRPSAAALGAEYGALLDWFNHLPVFARVDDFAGEDLSDGTKVWDALQQFVPNYFDGNLPEGLGSSRRRTSHVQNLQNIKKVYKSIRHYLVEECGASTPPGFDDSDLNLIAEGSSKTELALLLKSLLAIAVLHPGEDGNEPYLLAISQLQADHQGALAKVLNDLQEAEETAQQASPADKAPPPASPQPGASELPDDERVFRLMSENKDLEREKAALKKDLEDREQRLSRLQQNNNTLQEQLEQAQASLDSATTSDDQGFRVRDLEAKNKGQDDYIADLEERFQGAQDKETSLQTEINKLRKATEKLQPLQDEVDELKASRDSLSRRNNVLERYKNKLQSVQEIENENRALRREIEEMRFDTQQGDGAQQNNMALQREVMELKTLMSNTEIQLVEAVNRRKQIEYDNQELLQKLEEAAAQRERDQEAVSRMRDGSPGLEQPDGQFLDLDTELESSGKAENEKTNEIAKKQERYARVTNEEAARRMALEKLLDDEKKANTGLQKRNMELFQKNMAFESIMKGPDAEEHQKAYLEMQEKLDETIQQSQTLEKDKDAFAAQITDAEKTIAMYDHEKLEALETLKELNSKEAIELRAKIIGHEESNSDLKLQLEEHRAMLIEALKQAPAAAAAAAPQVVAPAPEAVVNEEEVKDTASAERIEELQEEVQAARDREKTQQEELEQRDKKIEELRGEVRATAEKLAPTLMRASEQAALKQENENLRRENKLMATAYYDLGSRLQMNNVSLQRRQEQPRSFLNRQRMLVTQAATVRTK